MLPLFENDSDCKNSSSIRLSVGIGVLIGVNSSGVDFDVGVLGVFGVLLLLDPGFLHRLILPEPILSSLVICGVGVLGGGACGEVALWRLELKSIFTPRMFSSTVVTEPSLALLDVVGASPLSLLVSSVSSIRLFGLRNAGCFSVGARCGGATVTGIGGFAGTASSYRRVIIPPSMRVFCCGDATDFVRNPPRPMPLFSLSGAMSTDESVVVVVESGRATASIYLSLGPASGDRVEQANE
jgi:hypothetical protein